MHGCKEEHHRNPLAEDSAGLDPSIACQVEAEKRNDDTEMAGKMNKPPDIGSCRQAPLLCRRQASQDVTVRGGLTHASL